ncbi:MAG TPA: hypothetical protein VGH32_09850 [Pirellulales bacterium]|jgi:hypothetical protein
MPNAATPNTGSRKIDRTLLVAWFIIGWLWVGIPLAAGVYFSIVQSLPLFESVAPAQPGK